MTPTRHHPTDTPMSSDRSAVLRAALDAAGRGWHVFPLTPGGKRPALHGADHCPATGPCAGGHRKWEQRATTDPDRIRAAWATGRYNIGIATGPAGLVVIDLDTPKPGDPPDTPHGLDTLTDLAADHDQPIGLDTYTVTTPTCGMHLYYAHPAGGPPLRNTSGTRGGLGPKIDTRAHGGYVVAAGSTTSRGAYTRDRDTPVAPLPGWLAGLLTPTPLPPQQPVHVDLPGQRISAYLQAAIDRQTTEITAAQPGQRNHALYVSAAALGQLVAGGSLPETLVRDTLTTAAATAGLGTRETERTINSGLRAGAQRPRTVAA